MKLGRIIPVVAALLALVAPPPASADHGCNGVIRTLSFNNTTMYMDDRGAGAGGIWLYLDTNGALGLQSGGLDPTGLIEDPCAHGSADMLVTRI